MIKPPFDWWADHPRDEMRAVFANQNMVSRRIAHQRRITRTINHRINALETVKAVKCNPLGMIGVDNAGIAAKPQPFGERVKRKDGNQRCAKLNQLRGHAQLTPAAQHIEHCADWRQVITRRRRTFGERFGLCALACLRERP